jgi:uncharacterized membrane-anchored protein YitT (DUF2179 family)
MQVGASVVGFPLSFFFFVSFFFFFFVNLPLSAFGVYKRSGKKCVNPFHSSR